MKQITKFLVLALAITLFSCEDKKEETPKLSITNVTAENHDGGTDVPLKGTISVDFEATAGEARLDFYHIEIHDHPTSGLLEDEYKIIDDDFKNLSTFSGLRNAHVHEHIQVPDTANLGSYHVVIVVVDKDGNSVNTEALETHINVVQ